MPQLALSSWFFRKFAQDAPNEVGIDDHQTNLLQLEVSCTLRALARSGGQGSPQSSALSLV
jgi:hypothetical protein